MNGGQCKEQESRLVGSTMIRGWRSMDVHNGTADDGRAADCDCSYEAVKRYSHCVAELRVNLHPNAMAELIAQVADKIDRAVQRVTPLAYRMQRQGRRWMRRAMRKPRSVSEGPNLLPLADPGAGQFFESRWRFAGGRNRLQPRLSALRLSGSGLFRVAAAVSAGALRAAGSLGDGAKAQRRS